MDQVILRGARSAACAVVLLSAAAAAQAKRVLVLRPAGATFEEARKGILETLGPDYALKDLVVARETSAEDVAKAWKESPPKVVVAMDNRSIALFRDARERSGDTGVPVVAIMGVRIDAAISGIGNSIGISYEIPVVTTLVNLRSILGTPVSRAAMVYRASWADMFRRNAAFCRGENIELVGVEVPDGSDPATGLEAALRRISSDRGIDALVVANDNFFLNASLLRKVWLPRVSGWKRPVVVGVESLVRPELRFGTFAILPDHYALGTQAAGLVQEIEEAGWKAAEHRTDQPLSVIKVLNLRGMDECCKVLEEKKSEIDRVLD